jgi:D-arabinose 1-dehydrogenase-like Zn-dependent alcohol dehydrogenase
VAPERLAGGDRPVAHGRLPVSFAGGQVDLGETTSTMPSRMASLLATWWYSDIASTPSSWASLRMLSDRTLDRPVPKDSEVLVRVHAAGLHRGDWHVMTGLPYLIRFVVPTLGLRRPKVPALGMDVAGRVEAVGAQVTRFQPGDEVFGWCGGSFAEYACASEDQFAAKPAALSFEQAAVVPISGFAALQSVRDQGEVRPGSRSW